MSTTSTPRPKKSQGHKTNHPKPSGKVSAHFQTVTCQRSVHFFTSLVWSFSKTLLLLYQLRSNIGTGIPTSLPFRHTSSLSTSVNCATATRRLQGGKSVERSKTANHFLKSLTSHEHVTHPSTTDPMILDAPNPFGVLGHSSHGFGLSSKVVQGETVLQETKRRSPLRNELPSQAFGPSKTGSKNRRADDLQNTRMCQLYSRTELYLLAAES